MDIRSVPGHNGNIRTFLANHTQNDTNTLLMPTQWILSVEAMSLQTAIFKKLVISCRLPPSMQKKKSILTVGVPESTQTSQRPLTCQCSIHSPHLIRWQNKRLPSGTKDSILPNNPSAIWLGCSNGHSLVPMPSSVSTATESTGAGTEQETNRGGHNSGGSMDQAAFHQLSPLKKPFLDPLRGGIAEQVPLPIEAGCACSSLPPLAAGGALFGPCLPVHF